MELLVNLLLFKVLVMSDIGLLITFIITEVKLSVLLNTMVQSSILMELTLMIYKNIKLKINVVLKDILKLVNIMKKKMLYIKNVIFSFLPPLNKP